MVPDPFQACGTRERGRGREGERERGREGEREGGREREREREGERKRAREGERERERERAREGERERDDDPASESSFTRVFAPSNHHSRVCSHRVIIVLVIPLDAPPAQRRFEFEIDFTLPIAKSRQRKRPTVLCFPLQFQC